MRPLTDRLLAFVASLLSLQFLYEGAFGLAFGVFPAPAIDPVDLPRTPGAVLLEDGRVVDYGAWAGPILERGGDPTDLAPFFLGLGVLGLFGVTQGRRRRFFSGALLCSVGAIACFRLGWYAVLGASVAVLAVGRLVGDARRARQAVAVPADAPAVDDDASAAR